ncbi:uncharacterized protein [Typha angustifolia]|uniref:uncharacterized protein n=1 Tax=Typha angustifolia TaxID=59011 RepID=UPI003C2FA241
MEDGDQTLTTNGGDESLTSPTPVSNGEQTLTKDQEADPKKDSPSAAAADADGDAGEENHTVDLLRKEIEGLKADKINLERELDDARRQQRAIADHAHRLEGEIYRAQSDLVASSTAAEDFDEQAREMRRAIDGLSAEKDALRTKIKSLEAKLAEAEGKDEVIASLEAKVKALEKEREEAEDKIKTLKEEMMRAEKNANKAAEWQAEKMAERELELNQALRELAERNSTLSEEIRTKREAELVPPKEMNVSWTAAGAVASVSVATAAAMTAVFLRLRR